MDVIFTLLPPLCRIDSPQKSTEPPHFRAIAGFSKSLAMVKVVDFLLRRSPFISVPPVATLPFKSFSLHVVIWALQQG